MKRKFTLLSTFLLCASIGLSQEICNNGIDDDNDGLIDLNDSLECACNSSIINSDLQGYVPNPSFENNTCCPSGYAQMSCVNDWYQPSSATSDYLNSCGFTVSSYFTDPAADGNGFVGIIGESWWLEYVATCLSKPFLANETYYFSFKVWGKGYTDWNGHTSAQQCEIFDDTLELVLYGNSVCSNAKLNTYKCPSAVDPSWIEIGRVKFQPSWSWQSVEIKVNTALDVNSIMLGYPCNFKSKSAISCNPYLAIDDIKLKSSKIIDLDIEKQGSICSKNLVLKAKTNDPNVTYQWYKDGVALIGEKAAELYVSAINLNNGKYSVISNINDSCFAANYLVNKEDCDIDESCFTNVITPNNDGYNDAFVMCENSVNVSSNIKFSSFSVFNRWGNELYHSENTLPTWDAKFNGVLVNDGVYFYTMKFSNKQGEEKSKSGWIQVIQ